MLPRTAAFFLLFAGREESEHEELLPVGGEAWHLQSDALC